mmetsp:Transcript_27794/g.74863  ORF Transcript_27794/g.74863 Transcript_27794/m.74863 type:complete len:224 (-) Transcript_27794:217-888(-)
MAEGDQEGVHPVHDDHEDGRVAVVAEGLEQSERQLPVRHRVGQPEGHPRPAKGLQLDVLDPAGEEPRGERAEEDGHEGGEAAPVLEVLVAKVDGKAKDCANDDTDKAGEGDGELVAVEEGGDEEGARLSHLAPHVPDDVEAQLRASHGEVGLPLRHPGLLLGIAVHAKPRGHLERERGDGQACHDLRDTLNDVHPEFGELLARLAKADAQPEDGEEGDEESDK